MADSSNTTRRQFLKAAPAVLAPAAGLAAFMAEAATPDEQVLHHIREIERILAETRPYGMEKPTAFFVVNGEIGCHAYPKGYARGDASAMYEPDRGGWTMMAGAV